MVLYPETGEGGAVGGEGDGADGGWVLGEVSHGQNSFIRVTIQFKPYSSYLSLFPKLHSSHNVRRLLSSFVPPLASGFI